MATLDVMYVDENEGNLTDKITCDRDKELSSPNIMNVFVDEDDELLLIQENNYQGA
jgi:hypothetical protein